MRTCTKCKAPATVYVMGPYAGDWADYYCDDHGREARESYGGRAIVEDVR